MSDLKIPVEMLLDIREGRYAIDPTGVGPLRFIRVSEMKNKNSRHKGWKIFQTQHSDDLVTRVRISPNGKLVEKISWTNDQLTETALAIITDPWGAAIRYGQELGQCCRCGKSLTDERSRWYGIGPECEILWPEVIYEVNENRGPYEESHNGRG